MRTFLYLSVAIIGVIVSSNKANAQVAADCPDPLFECIPWGPEGPDPGGPPTPIFRPVAPHLERYIDFNRSYGVIENDVLILNEGTPELVQEASDHLSRHREWINPNGTYLLLPDAFLSDAPLGSGVIIGGGALTQ
jgi:hypothetical protein